MFYCHFYLFCYYYFIIIGGSDFVPSANDLIVFNPGEMSRTVSIEIIDDAVFEELVEIFYLSLSSNIDSLLLDPNKATISVIDDDSKTIKYYYNNIIMMIILFCMCTCMFHGISTVITIGFLNTTYYFEESSGTVTVPVSVQNGAFDESVSTNVRLSTLDLSAKSK